MAANKWNMQNFTSYLRIVYPSIMSQLATFSRQVEAAKVAIEKLQSESIDSNNTTAVANHFTAARKLLHQLETDLIPSSDKLRQKLGQVDPVTGAKRYGAQAEQKFFASAELLQQEYNVLKEHIQQHEDQFLTAEQLVEAEKERQRKAKEDALPMPVMSKIIVEHFNDNSGNTNADGTFENDELHQKAEELRVKKQKEMDELRDFERRLDLYLRNNYADRLNNLLYLSDVTTVINTIKTSSNFVASDWKVMKTLLLDIMNRIVSKPDDVNLRKLRLTHPTIQGKITGKTGGIPLLLALGFRIVVKKESVASKSGSNSAATSMVQDPSADEDDVSHQPVRAQWLRQHRHDWEHLFCAEDIVPSNMHDVILHDYTSAFVLCNSSSSSPWELLAEMEEPPVDDLLLTAVTDAIAANSPAPGNSLKKLSWIDWYDRLQASIALLEKS